MTSFYEKTTVINWKNSLNKTGDDAIILSQLAEETPLSIDETKYYRINNDGEGFLNNNNVQKTNLYNSFNDVRIARQIITYNELQEIGNRCYDLSGILNTVIIENEIKEKILLEQPLITSLDKLLLDIGKLEPIQSKEILLYSNEGAVRKFMSTAITDWFEEFITDKLTISYIELRGDTPLINTSILSNLLNIIDLNNITDPPAGLSPTPISIGQEGTRDLLDKLEKNRSAQSSSSSSGIVTNNAILRQIKNNQIALAEMLDCCGQILVNTVEITPKIMNIRYRNIQLNVDEDTSYPLNVWLYNFQAEIIGLIYDMGDYFNVLNIQMDILKTSIDIVALNQSTMNSKLDIIIPSLTVLSQGQLTIAEGIDLIRDEILEEIETVKNQQQIITDKVDNLIAICSTILDKVNV